MLLELDFRFSSLICRIFFFFITAIQYFSFDFICNYFSLYVMILAYMLFILLYLCSGFLAGLVSEWQFAESVKCGIWAATEVGCGATLSNNNTVYSTQNINTKKNPE